MNQLALNETNIKEGLFVNDEEFNRLKDNFSTLQDELERDFNEPCLESGYILKELTRIETKDILNTYSQTV